MPMLNIKKTALFYITNECNLNCTHCGVYDGKSKIKRNDILSLQEITIIIDKLQQNGVNHLTLTGGEPFTRKDLLSILKYAKDSGMEICINTNLTFLPDEIEEIISKELLDAIFISIDGSNKHSHDKIRGYGNFERSIENLEIINKLKRHIRKNVDISFITVPNKTNYKELESIFDLAESYNIHSVNLESLIESGKAHDNQERLALNEDQLLQIHRVVMTSILSRKKIKIQLNTITNAFIEYYNMIFNTSIPYFYFSCPSPHKYLYINYDGCILPCASFSKQAGYDVYNCTGLSLIKNNFNEILNSPQFSLFETIKHDVGNLKKLSPCNHCKFLGNYCSPCVSNLIMHQNTNFQICNASINALKLLA